MSLDEAGKCCVSFSLRGTPDYLFEIKRTTYPMTDAFVGIDLYGPRSDKAIKVTHYTCGCENTQDCPRFFITLPEHEHWFKYYKKIIDKQWTTATAYTLTTSCDTVFNEAACTALKDNHPPNL